MKTSINRADLRMAAENGSILTVNGHSLTVESINKTDSGKQRFTVCVDGQKYENLYLKGVQNLLGITEKSGQSTVVPKSQKAEKTASNIDKTVTRRYSFKGLSVEDTQKLAFARVDALRDEINRAEREISLLLAFSNIESMIQEQNILKARETAANNRKRDVQARVNRLQSYIDTYAKRVGDTMLSGNIEKAQLLVATQAARLSRAQALIAELNNMQ